MPAAPYPTLSGGGYIYDPPQKIEWIFADYVAAKHSQSTIFFGGISSLSYDEYAGNYDGMTTVEILKASLEKLYNAYFDSAEFTVTDNSVEGSTVLSVGIVGELIQAGVTYKLNEVLTLNSAMIKKLATFKT